MIDDIKKKIDEAMAKKPEDMTAHDLIMAVNTTVPLLRLEALKMAYETAYKCEVNSVDDWRRKSDEEKAQLLDDVFFLAARNHQFIIGE